MSKTKHFSQYQTRFSVVMRTIASLSVLLVSTPEIVSAQITPDATLGHENSFVTPGVNIKNQLTDVIKGGATRGSSLFHSFLEFNVNDGQRVYFDNPANINNIFSRVTGNNVSHILGTLGVNGNANLYLLNPNGIIFGKDATLDIQGSFFATTANSFTFPDGNEFSATNPQIPLLTMSVPDGVQFGSQPGDISSQGNLKVGKDLTLSAGNLDLQGQLIAGGNVTLATATGNINVNLISTTSEIGNAGSIDIRAKGDIIGNLISAANFQSTSNGNAGNILLLSEQGKVVIKGGEYKTRNFALGTFLDSYSSDKQQAGNIIIQASQDIDIGSNLNKPPSGAINASVLAKDSNVNAGNSGLIQISSTSGNITVNGGIFTNSTSIAKSGNSSNSGSIELTAKQGAITVNPNGTGSIITRSIAANKTGDAGSIKIDGRQITINPRGNASTPDVTTESNQTGQAGSISFNSQMPLQLTGLKIGTDARDGNAGDVRIHAPVIALDNSKISTTTSGTGVPGNISLIANEDVSIKNSQITSNSNTQANKYPVITIKSETTSIDINGSTISVQNKDSGLAGDIYINASDLIQINNSKINAEGTQGFIVIGFDPLNNFFVPQTIKINNSHLTTNKNQSSRNTEFSSRNIELANSAGVIGIRANGSTTIANNSNLESVTSGDAEGGLIYISTGSLFIRNGSKLDTSTSGKGSAGNIGIEADTLIIETQGSITSSANKQGQGSAGNIKITSSNINLSDKAKIEVDSISPENTSSAGTINLNTNFLKLDNASITAKNASGNGGEIEITTQNLVLRNNSRISTSAGSANTLGNGGKIKITAENGYVISVPTEDSDIIANAFGGKGGKIDISAIRALGFATKSRLNTAQLAKIDNNGTSDISASSDVGTDGDVEIKTIGIDPSQGLVEIPTNLVDPSGLIAQGCNSNNSNVAQSQSEFVVTGRGGIPPSPDDVLTAGVLPTKWVTRAEGNRAILPIGMIPNTAPLVEAQGMVRNANGDIVLIAQPVISTNFQSGLSSQLCGVAQKEKNKL